MTEFVLWPLADLLSAGFSEDCLAEQFNKFECKDEKDVAEYLRTRAISDERAHRARTYLFLDANRMRNADIAVAGMFTLSVTVVQGLRESEFFEPAYMLLQFARSDEFEGELDGAEMMFEAQAIVRDASSAVGGAFLFLDCKADKKRLVDSYKEKGFIQLDGEGAEPGLTRMAMYLY